MTEQEYTLWWVKDTLKALAQSLAIYALPISLYWITR